MDRGLISRKARGSFANPPWLTGTLGVDFGLDPIWATRSRSDGWDGSDGWRRRRAAGGELWRRIAGLGRIGRPGLDFERSFDWEQGRDTAKPSRAAVRASMAGAELAAAHGGQRRRRALPGEIAREGGERKGSCGFTTLRRNSGAARGHRGSCGTAARWRAPSSGRASTITARVCA